MERIELRFKCPFFKSLYRCNIYCEPIGEDMSSTAASFGSKRERDDYIQNFCSSHCWQGCAVAQACLKKYDENSGS